MSDHEAEARARLSTKEGRIEAITQRAYSRRFGSGNSNYIRECADDEYELLGFLADAEARAERLETRLMMAERVCKAVGMYESSTTAVVPYTEPKMRDAYVTWRNYLHSKAAVSKPTNDAPA